MIRSFTAAMIWGVFVATASSIFIGGPILIYFNLAPDRRARAERSRETAKPAEGLSRMSAERRRLPDRAGPLSGPRADRGLRQWRLPLRRHVASRLDPGAAERHRGWPVASAAEITPETPGAHHRRGGSDRDPADRHRRRDSCRLRARRAQALEAAGLAPEPMATGAAVRTYNVLLSEERGPSPPR